MTKADTYLILVDEQQLPEAVHPYRRFECDRAPVLGAQFLMTRGQVLAVNYSEIEKGVVKATFDAHARVHAIVWYVPRGAKRRK